MQSAQQAVIKNILILLLGIFTRLNRIPCITASLVRTVLLPVWSEHSERELNLEEDHWERILTKFLQTLSGLLTLKRTQLL